MTKRSRKQQRPDPAYMTWRKGKPLWRPGPALRAAGWRNIALTDEGGTYLSRGDARRMARAINEDVARVARGEPAKRFSPDPTRTPIEARPAGTRTLAHAAEHFFQHRSFRKLARASQVGYRNNLAAFIAWTGGEHPAAVTRADLSAWFEARWDRIFAGKVLGWTDAEFDTAPRARDAHGAAYVVAVRSERWAAQTRAREDNCNVPGQAQMIGHIRAISRLYSHIDRELGWIPADYNPAARFDLTKLKPRLRLPTDQELAHLVKTADKMGRPGVADVMIYMANMGPRPADLVALPLTIFDAGAIDGRIRKTGARVSVKLARVVMDRGALMRGRRAQLARDAKVKTLPPAAFLTDRRAQAWTVGHLEHEFAAVREAAAAKMPAVADLTLYDFRSLAITRLHLAGNSRDTIAAITRHSYATINEILDHYIVPTRAAADEAIDRLDDYMETKGLKW